MKRLIEIKSCQECGDPISGRSDKKFCSDQCRVSYNNRESSSALNFMRTVNYAIRKNRRILTRLNSGEKTQVSREELAQHGFNFNYFTNTCKTKEGCIHYYCYEQGYIPVEKDSYLLVVKQDLRS